MWIFKPILFCVILLAFSAADHARTHVQQCAVNLDSWVGIYDFFEFSPGLYGSNQMVGYELVVFPNTGHGYFAYLSMNGWMTHKRVLARVEGDRNEIRLVLESRVFLWDEPPIVRLDEEEVLLTFRMCGDEMLTEWGTIIPMLPDINVSGKVHFEKR